MKKAAVDLDDVTKDVFFNHPAETLHSRPKRQLRATSDETIPMPAYAGHNSIICFFVYAEGLFAHQVFACVESGTIKFLVQMVR